MLISILLAAALHTPTDATNQVLPPSHSPDGAAVQLIEPGRVDYLDGWTWAPIEGWSY